MNQSISHKFCCAELSSHADTCGVNDVAYFMEYTGKVVQVSGFAKNLQILNDISIVIAAVAYDYHHIGETTIIIINQALYFGDHLTHIYDYIKIRCRHIA